MKNEKKGAGEGPREIDTFKIQHPTSKIHFCLASPKMMKTKAEMPMTKG